MPELGDILRVVQVDQENQMTDLGNQMKTLGDLHRRLESSVSAINYFDASNFSLPGESASLMDFAQVQMERVQSAGSKDEMQLELDKYFELGKLIERLMHSGIDVTKKFEVDPQSRVIPLEELELDNNIARALKRHNISSANQLSLLSDEELLSLGLRKIAISRIRIALTGLNQTDQSLSSNPQG